MDLYNQIQFQSPHLADLTARHTVVDLHFHSHYSDGSDSVEKIAARMRELGIGLAITDHNAIAGAVELDRYRDLLTIPAIEVTSREGTHVLVYFYRLKDLKLFYKKDVEPYMGSSVMAAIDLDMASILERARNYNTVIVFPHPYAAGFTGVCNPGFTDSQSHHLLSLADGIEAINAENLSRWNIRGALLGASLEKAMTGGSDGHSIRQMGAAVTYADCKPTRKAFLDALRKKETRVMGKESNLLAKIRSNSAKLKVGLHNYPDLVEKNIRYGKTVVRFQARKAVDKIWDESDSRHIRNACYVVAGLAFVKINYHFLPLAAFGLMT